MGCGKRVLGDSVKLENIASSCLEDAGDLRFRGWRVQKIGGGKNLRVAAEA